MIDLAEDGFRIRTATKEDLDKLGEMMKEGRFALDLGQESVKNPEVIVASRGQTLIGFCTLGESLKNPRIGIIQRLEIDKRLERPSLKEMKEIKLFRKSQEFSDMARRLVAKAHGKLRKRKMHTIHTVVESAALTALERLGYSGIRTYNLKRRQVVSMTRKTTFKKPGASVKKPASRSRRL